MGIDFTVAYTRSRSLDDVSQGFAFSGDGPSLINTGASPAAGFQGGGPSGWIERPVQADWGYSTFDVPHLLSASHVWEIPAGRGRRFLSRLPRILEGLIGGWDLSGIVAVRSGSLFNVTLSADVNDDGATDDRPALAGGKISNVYAAGAGKTQWLLPQADARTRKATNFLTRCSLTSQWSSRLPETMSSQRLMWAPLGAGWGESKCSSILQPA